MQLDALVDKSQFMDNEPTFWHEKLDVYRHSLAFCSRMDETLSEACPSFAAVDHLNRASESILENLVNGNSSWSTSVKQQYFHVAQGSALECAACLDIVHIRGAIQAETWQSEKRELRRIVQMLAGLSRSQKLEVNETADGWGRSNSPENGVFFDHERLDVYQLALEFYRWGFALIGKCQVTSRRAKRLDTLSTSILLNIAEGNGRFDSSDHRKFVDIAHQSSLKCVVAIDLMLAKKEADAADLSHGKQMLSRIVKMLLGMRGYLEGEV